MSTTRQDTLKAVFSVLGLSSTIQDVIDKGINSIGTLCLFTEDELPDTLNTANAKTITLFKQWFAERNSNQLSSSPFDWSTFTADVWEDYMLSQIKSTPEEKLSSSAVNPNNPTNKPTTNTTHDLPQFKIDMKSYPEFDGKLTSWKAFKQKFTSVATIHDIYDIMVPDYTVPIKPNNSDAEIETYQKKSLFLQSILEYSLAKTTVTVLVKRHSQQSDGRSSWLDLVKWFEGQGSQEIIPKKALTVLATHKLYPASH